jgi:hypothetical protein
LGYELREKTLRRRKCDRQRKVYLVCIKLLNSGHVRISSTGLLRCRPKNKSSSIGEVQILKRQTNRRLYEKTIHVEMINKHLEAKFQYRVRNHKRSPLVPSLSQTNTDNLYIYSFSNPNK